MISTHGISPIAGPARFMNIRIRSMQPSDLDAVVEIDRRSFSLPWPENAFRYELAQNSAALLRVAVIDLPDEVEKVVGAIVIWMILDEAHIATLAVHPDYRRLGIGSKLLADSLGAAIKRGAYQAMLEVRASNQAAQDLYRRFGFLVVGRRLHYYTDNREDAVLMTADLRSLDHLEG
jgi:ribosomal-protein-alanine N-acetyltransferase